MLNRRRFLSITAAATLAPGMSRAKVHVETGLALGARVTLRLDHPDAARISALAMTEIRRLERIFSLYDPDSALVRLNRDGLLDAPPFELLDCLTLAGAVHRASGARFDPTVQVLWRAEADATQAGRPLSETERREAISLIGWQHVRLESDAIRLMPGQALTLNGIAQGYIADRVAALLAGHGLTRALIDTGEMVALGEGTWPVHLDPMGKIDLSGRALATSAPLGMTFGNDGLRSHILDPRTGAPVLADRRSVSISSPRAAIADAVATAGCLISDDADLAALCSAFPGTRIEALA